MSTPFLSRFENRVVFRISRLFWHVFTIVGCLAIVAGIAVWAWSKTPTSKRTVTKAEYPPEARVEVSDFRFEEARTPTARVVQPVQGTSSVQTNETEPIVQDFATEDLDKPGYNRLVDSLELATPYLNWLGGGYYFYPQGESAYIMAKKKNLPNIGTYRIWVADGTGLDMRWERCYDSWGMKAYADRTLFLREFFGSLHKLHVDTMSSRSVVETVIQELRPKNGSADPLKQIQSATAMAFPFPADDRARVFRWCINYFKRSEEPSYAYLDTARSFITDLEGDQQFAALKNLTNEFESRFSRDLTALSTQLHLLKALIPSIPREHQAEAVRQFFAMYAEKNRERGKTIAQIEASFREDLANAAFEQNAQAELKSSLGSKGLYGIGLGILLVAVFALVLAVLAMQRAVSKLEEVIVSQRSAKE